MSRCGHESVFYRVFCVTLLAIAFCFSLILSNVFIDIDGLLTGQGTAIPDRKIHIDKVDAKEITVVKNANPEQNLIDDEKIYRNYPDEDDKYYRSKRSSDFSNSKLNIQNPKIKSIISNRLASLLEELDSEEAKSATHKVQEQTERIEEITQPQENKENDESVQQKETKDNEKIRRKEKLFTENQDVLYKVDARRSEQPRDNNKELLRLAMQNLLLGGVINHLDLSDIYKEVHTLVEDFNGLKEVEDVNSWEQPKLNSKSEVNTKAQYNSNEMKEFLGELYNYINKKKMAKNTKKNVSDSKKSKKVFINATIDIITDDKDNTTLEAGDVKGTIKINYNGVPVQLKNTTELSRNENLDREKLMGLAIEQTAANPENFTYLHQFLRQYAKMYNGNREIKIVPTYSKTIHRYKATRMKRHIKVQLNDQKEAARMEHVTANNHNAVGKNEDDDVSVEINTHFNNKGINVEKKKKLIGTIIEKIAQVIQHSSLDYKNDAKTKKPMKHWNVKRRAQNPLENKNEYPHYYALINPIRISSYSKQTDFNKVLEPHKHDVLRLPRKQNEPKIFSKSKAINSAETGNVDVFYDSVLPSNGIPQRLQKPLTSDNIDVSQDNLYSNTHNVKFLIKNIDGSGFSIGINQYTDLPPDAENMKIFTALESLIKAYQQKYDVTDEENDSLNHKEKYIRFEHSHSISKRDTRKLINENVNNTDAFKNLIETNLRISNSDKKNVTTQNFNVINLISKNDIISTNRYVMSKKNVKRDFQTKELYNLASILNRKPRSTFANLIPFKFTRQKLFNRQLSFNKFVRSKPVPYFKQVFFRKKRNKRQVSVLDEIQNDHGDGMFLISDEDEVSDKAVVANTDPEEDIGAIVNENDNIDNYRKFHENEDNSYNYLINRRRHNKMMSNYPHIFYENSEKFLRDDPENFPSQYLRTKISVNKLPDQPLTDDKVLEFGNESGKSGDLQQLVHAISPSIDKENYKLTIKIKPFKNNSTTGGVTGFKQIHTSINKSFNRNGMNFMTSFNVSEVSKIEKVHKEGEKNNGGKTLESIHKDTNENHGNLPVESLTNDTNTDTNNGAIQTLYKSSFTNSPWNENKHNPVLTSTLNNNKQPEQNDNQRQNPSTRRQNDKLENTKNKENILKTSKQRVIEENPPEENPQVSEDLLDITIPSNPPKLLRLNREEVSKIVSSTLAKLQDIPSFHELSEKLNKQQLTSTNATTTTTVSSTLRRPPTPKNELLLAKIIGYNVQLTNEILKRIDSNTDMLSTFLDKLDSTIITPARIANAPKPEEMKTQPDDEHLNPKVHNMKHKGNVLVYSFQHPHFVVGKKPSASALCRRIIDKAIKPDTKSVYYKGPTHFSLNHQMFINNQTNAFVNDGPESTDIEIPNATSEVAMPAPDNTNSGNVRDIEDGVVNRK